MVRMNPEDEELAKQQCFLERLKQVLRGQRPLQHKHIP